MINRNKYTVLTKLFDLTKPYSRDIIDLILKNNEENLIFRNKKNKKSYNDIPTQVYEGNTFELVLTNSKQEFCSVEFNGFGMEGEIYMYNIENTNFEKIYSLLSKFYNSELDINSKDLTIYI